MSGRAAIAPHVPQELVPPMSARTGFRQDPHDARIEQLRVPPHSIEAEQAVLGGLMLAPEAYDRINDKLTANDFYRRDHQLIYRAIAELAEKNRPFDAVTLGEVQVFLEQGTPNPDGISVYFVVGNADELYKRMSLSSCLEEILLHSNDQLEQLRTWNSELRTKTRRLQNSGLDVPGSGVRSSKFEVRSSTGRQAGGAPQPPDTAYDGIGAGNFASPKASRMSRFVSKYTCQ